LLWTGAVLCSIGAALIAASMVLGYMGLSGSYNFGDPAKFQFYLVPLWQIGCAVAVVGGALLLLSRWVKANRS
jgi:ABC-type enterochelin transport system permease subunit